MTTDYNMTNNASRPWDRSAAVKTIATTKPFIVGVAGGTASGKTSVCAKIMEILEQEQLTAGERRVVTISQDSFYKALPESDRKLADEGKYNFDHPDALDAPRIVEAIRALIRGEQVDIPKYDFKNNRPDPDNYDTVYPADVIILEGILVFHYAELRDMFHLKLFVDLDADSRLARRVVRDNQHRGRSLQNILRQYVQFVKPAFEDFCLPTKIYADIIIPRGAENDVAIVLICQHIKQYLPQPQQRQQQLGINVAGASELRHSVSEITLPTALVPNNESSSASRQLGNFSNAFSPASPAPKIVAPTNIDIPAATTNATSIHSDRAANHSSAYMRARSFNNESSVTTTTNDLNLSDDDDQEDHAFESEFVHHRHHTFTTQVSRRRRERERTLSTGSMSRMVSVDNSFNSSGLSTSSSSQQQSPLANPMNQSSSSDQAPHQATSKT